VPSPVPLPRRTVLRIAGGTAGAVALASTTAALASCSPRDPAAEPDRASEAIAALRAGEQALVARYRQVHARFPALRPVLGGVLADHVAHTAALGAVLPPSPASPVPPGTGAPVRPVPATPAAALAELVAAERDAAAAATAACLLAGGDTAALLASVAACEASHLVVLR
jgi:hypothetical protein